MTYPVIKITVRDFGTMTAELYPEYCDYDAKAEILEFYKLFYHCELTEQQYSDLTANGYLE